MTGESGKAKVKRVLIEPLVKGGMRKSPKHKVEEHGAMLDRIAGKLSYLSEEQLGGLREFCIRAASGREHDIWPEEQHIVNWAYRQEAPPAERNEYVSSLMRSAMGQKAFMGGYHVELFIAACRWGPPPSKYEISKLRQRADDNRSKRERVQRAVSRGDVAEIDRQWLGWFEDQERRCLEVMQAEGEGAWA